MKFYILTEKDAKRCQLALQAKIPVTMHGHTEEGKPQIYTGVIQSIREEGFGLKRRWRVMMRT